MQAVFISVIMPFFNTAPYLKEAIQSVLEQTYVHWELLLADDGSTDGSKEIAKAYEKEHPEKIFYLCHPENQHMGTVATRLLAIRRARGNYLAFLDSDDRWLNEKLAFQVAIIKQYPEAGMICGATKYWYSWSDPKKTDEIVTVGGPQDKLLLPPRVATALYPLGEGAAPCLCSIMLKKATAMKYEGLRKYFSGKYQLYEDQAFLIKVYLSEAVFISSAAMDLYRQRPDSTMHALTGAGYYEDVRHYFLTWLKRYLIAEKMTGTPVWRAVKKLLWKYNNPLLYTLKRKLAGYVTASKNFF